jgi:DNA-binding LacI/PurR family transcriptional regulator
MNSVRSGDAHKPLYLKIADRLRADITAGKFVVGEKIPSRQELVRQFRTTPVTLDRAMRVLMDEGLLYSENGRGTFVADRTRHARSPNRLLTFAAIMPQRQAHNMMLMLSGISSGLNRLDCQLAYYEAAYRPDLEAEQIQRALRHRVAGIILHPVRQATNLPLYQRVVEQGVPLVLMSLSFAGFDSDWVGVDNFGEAKKTVEHLIRLGHRRIAHLTYRRDLVKPLIYRALGYEAALKVHDIPVDPALMVETDSVAEGTAALDRWLDMEEPPTAIFAASDWWMMTTLTHLRARNVRVPEQMSVVGIMDGPELSPGFATFPAPTGVLQSAHLIGEKAAEIAVGKATGKIPFTERKEVMVPAEFLTGRSCMSLSRTLSSR